MKRLMLIAFLCGVLCYHGNLYADNPTISLATGEWAPYTSQDMVGHGVFTEIVKAIFEEIGIEPLYTFYPWKRAEYLVKEGSAFAAFPYFQTDERKKIFYFSAPVMISTGRLFYLKRNFPNGIDYKKLDELASYKISGVLGYWYETPFKEAHLNVEYVVSDEQSIKKLYLDRVELVASEELVGWSLIKHLYPKEASLFGTIDPPLNQDELRLMISKNYPNAIELTKRFNSGLEAIRKNGILSQILAKHGVRQ